MENLEEKSILELLELKEKYRAKYGLYIENNLKERGSFNDKTDEYFTCEFIKRINHPTKRGIMYNEVRCYQTFGTYKQALMFCLHIAEHVNAEIQ